MDRRYEYALCQGQIGVTYKHNRFAFKDIVDMHDMGQANQGEQYFISFDYLFNRKSISSSGSFVVKDVDIELLSKIDSKIAPRSIQEKAFPTIYNGSFGVAITTQREVARWLNNYPFDDSFGDFPYLSTNQCYFLSFDAAAKLKPVPLEVVDISQLSVFDCSLLKKSLLVAVETPGLKSSLMDISGITSCADQSALSDATYTGRSLDISTDSSTKVYNFSKKISGAKVGNKSTPTSAVSRPESTISSKQSSSGSSPAVNSKAVVSGSPSTKTRRANPLRVDGPSDLSPYVFGESMSSNRCESGESDKKCLDLFRMIYPYLKEIGWSVETWVNFPIPLQDEIVYRSPQWNDLRVKERIENIEIFHTKAAFAKHLATYPCYSQSFDELWGDLQAAGWTKKAIDGNTLVPGSNGNIFVFQYAVRMGGKLDKAEKSMISNLKDVIRLELLEEESKYSSLLSHEIVPGVHLFTTSRTITQFISKFPFLLLPDDKLAEQFKRHNIVEDSSNHTWNIEAINIKGVTLHQLRHLMWLNPSLLFTNYSSITRPQLVQALRIPIHVAVDLKHAEIETKLADIVIQESGYISLSQHSNASSSSPMVPMKANEIKRIAGLICNKEIDDETVNVYDFFDVLMSQGWKTGCATWSSHWWKDMMVYSAPWCPAESPVVGIDYFFNSDDMLDYLAAYGPKRVNVSTQSLRVDYTKSKWTVTTAIIHFAKSNSIEPLKKLLFQEGWIEEYYNAKFKLMIPPHRVKDSYTICKNRATFEENVDFFIDDRKLVKHVLAMYKRRQAVESPSAKSSDPANRKANEPPKGRLVEIVQSKPAELANVKSSSSVTSPSSSTSTPRKRGRPPKNQSVNSPVDNIDREAVIGAAKVSGKRSADGELKQAKKNEASEDLTLIPKPVGAACSSSSDSNNSGALLEQRNESLKVIIEAHRADSKMWNDQSVFKDVWPFLKSIGWRKDYIKEASLTSDYIEYFMPPWSTVKASKSWVQSNLNRENRDFFQSSAALLKYVFKYGCGNTSVSTKATPVKFATVESRRESFAVEESFVDYYERNKPVAPPPVPAVEAKKADKQPTAKKAKKIKLPALPSPPKSRRVILDGPISADVIADLRNVFDDYARSRSYYIFPYLWAILQECGWKSFSNPSAGIDSVIYCHPARSITADDCTDLESKGFVLNTDYFDNKDHFQIYIHQQCFPEDNLPELPKQSRKRFAFTFADYFDKYHKLYELPFKFSVCESDGDDDSYMGSEFEPEWQALYQAATRKHNKLDLSNFDKVWKLCRETSDNQYRISKIAKTAYYCRQHVHISTVADLSNYVRNKHYFTSAGDFLAFVHNWGRARGVDVEKLIVAAKADISATEHVSDSSVSSDSSAFAASEDDIDLPNCMPYKSLRGTRQLSEEHHYDKLVESMGSPGTPLLTSGEHALDFTVSPISDISDNDGGYEDPLVALLQNPNAPFARIFELLKDCSPPWTWINKAIPSELCGEPIPHGVECIYFKPEKSLKSEGMKRGVDFFCRESELIDYLRVEIGLQREKKYDSESKKSRKTRSGKTLASSASADIMIADAGKTAMGSLIPSVSSYESPVSTALSRQKKRKASDSEPVEAKACTAAVQVKEKTCSNAVDDALAALKPGAAALVADGTRNNELEKLEDKITMCLAGQHGGSVYVCGNPGFGKTLAVRTLLDRILVSEHNPICRVDILGTSLHPDSMWKLIAEQLGLPNQNNSDSKVSVLSRLRSAASQRGRKIIPLTILVIDEIDKAPKEDIRELLDIAGAKNVSLENGPVCFSPTNSLANGSSLLLISIANSMTFPMDMGLAASTRPESIVFPAYTAKEISTILQQRTYGLFEQKALEMLVKGIAGGGGGDVRRGMEIAAKCIQQELERRKEADATALRALLDGSVQAVVGIKTVHPMLLSYGLVSSSKLPDLFNGLSQFAKIFLVSIVIGGLEQAASSARDMTRMFNTYLLSRSMTEQTLQEVVIYINELECCGFLEGGASGFGGARRAQNREEAEYRLQVFEVNAEKLLRLKDLAEMHQAPLRQYIASKS